MKPSSLSLSVLCINIWLPRDSNYMRGVANLAKESMNSLTMLLRALVRVVTLKRSRRALGLVFFLAAASANAQTDCLVTLKNAFTGDNGTGLYVLWLTYSYTASTGSVYTGQGYILLSNPAAANISAVVLEAQAMQQSELTIRLENTSGATEDAVCEGSPARSDLAGIWLHQ
jgi:hypothetical protein